MNLGLEFFRKLSIESDISNELREIKEHEDNNATYHKTVIHLHTPASHDYKVLGEGKNPKKKLYSQYKQTEILNISKEKKLFRFDKLNGEYLEGLAKNDPLFSSYKELLCYLMIADDLYKKQIELAVITDHNNIKGYKKLKDAVSILKKGWKDSNSIIPSIQLGIEMTCGDVLHVVGIFDESEDAIKNIEDFLNKNLVSEKEGTYLPSWEVMNSFRNLGGISYVAHFNTSDVLNKKGTYSGAYKQKLLSNENMSIVGLSKLDSSEGLRKKLKEERGIDNIVVLPDDDSHELDTLGHNAFWMKGQTIDFNMILNAIYDSDISVQINKPKLPKTYVRSVHIKGNGFLGKTDQSFDVSFSTALNCIIGGCGTGKSTLLDCINLVLSQKIYNLNQLKNVCSQGRIILDVVYESVDYYVRFNPVTNDCPDDEFVRTYLYGSENIYQHSERVELNPNFEDLKNKTRDKIQIFKIDKSSIFEVKKKSVLLDAIFKSAYSINQLVKFATDNRVTDFIFEQLNKKKSIVRKISRVNIENDEQLKDQNNLLVSKLKFRNKNVQEIISPFNENNSNVKLQYSQFPIKKMRFNWRKNIKPSVTKYNSRSFGKFNIGLEEILSFLDELTEKLNPIKVYLMFKKHDWNNIESNSDILSFTHQLTQKDVDNGISNLDQSNKEQILKLIFNKIIEPSTIDIYSFINNYIQVVDNFDLQLDINSYEHDASRKVKFKSVRNVSLGQKVVALLDFIFLFGKFSKDRTPLLLDQPEDNLDSTYIYKHLVQSLRTEKDKRQVIIVTHNSTIVTNSKPEEVISLESDNSHAWIRSTGYPTEERVVASILNLLEGGKESFIHKEFIYKNILGKSN